jgi:acetyl-CoA carboxylase biotin carboxyl carrier protein
MVTMELEPADIAEILRIFAESELEELRLEVGGTRLHLSKRGATTLDATAAVRPVSQPPTSAPTTSAPVVPAPAGPASTEPNSPGAATPASAPSPSAAAAAEEGLLELRSPLLGVFYRRPAPGEAPFVEIGQTVGPDDDVCIVDVMKMFTRVAAGVAGELVEICVDDGALVEHGQVLMRFRPS